MKTKVVEFIGRIQDGGAETLVKDYAMLLDKEKFDVTILCEDYRKNSTNYQTIKSENIKLVSMYDPFPLLCRIMARLFGPSFVAMLFKRAMKKLKPDVMHIHLELLDIVYHGKEVLDGVDLFFTCHNPPQMLIGDQRPKERDACRKLIDEYGMRIVALHSDMAKEIDQMYGLNNTAVIHNAVNFKLFEIDESKEEIRKTLGIDANTYVVGNVGRFAYQKNQEFLLDVFKVVKEKKPDSKLLLIGRGELINELQSKAKKLGIEKDVMILTGRDDVPRLLKAMDVFAFSSRFEGLGIVLIEAQVSGLPCVVSENIPEEAFQSKRITRLSLSDPLEKWADMLIDPVANVECNKDINDYDMNKEIHNLEKLYLKEE